MTLSESESCPGAPVDDVSQVGWDAKTNLEVAWEYEVSRGKWVRYDKVITSKLNSLKKETCLEFEFEDSKLSVDLVSMKQKNLTTGFVRSIRCLCMDNKGRYAWECNEKRRWHSFEVATLLKLETAFREGLAGIEIIFAGETYIVDFESRTCKSKDGTKIFKIRRELSDAASSLAANPAPSAERIQSLRKRNAEVVHKEGEVDSTSGDFAENVALKKSRARSKENSDPVTVPTKVETCEGKNVRKVLLKGSAAVDPECSAKVDSAHVYVEGNDIYDALLNQTNTQNNNNKYYILQLLEEDAQKNYSVWFRWGRVGYKGQSDLIPCGASLERAKEIFCRKFADKTHNEWSFRLQFRKVSGKYDYLPADYTKVKAEDKEKNEATEKKSKLDLCIQNFLNLICDLKNMERDVMELEYDAVKAPLGKLTDKQIKNGYSLLKKIEKFIKNQDFSKHFIEAVNDYYTKIPHSFGMRQPPLIKSVEQLKMELSLLEMLGNIEIGIRTIRKGAEDSDLHPIDRKYLNMNCDITVVAFEDPCYKLVEKYLQNTQAPTHDRYRMKIKQLFAINRHEETKKFMKHLGNRMLLWHGSRMTNWYGILSQGLRIAPPEAPSTGFMFGKGIYFADMSSKSANYSFPQKNKPGIVILAEVALGESRLLLKDDYNADKIADGKDSTIGLGRTGPDPQMEELIDDGCVVPCGKPIDLADNRSKNCALNYNEYVVYNVDQVRIRYAVVLDFIFNS